MDGQLFVQLAVAAFSAGTVGAIVSAITNRRKISAEATKTITEAAAGVTETVMADNARLRAELDKVKVEMTEKLGVAEGKIDLLEKALKIADERERIHLVSEERNNAHLERWHRYCARQTDALRGLGCDMDDPPPLFPERINAPTLYGGADQIPGSD
jgi:hypothetical protein